MGQYQSPPDLAQIISDLASRVAALERTRTIATGAVTPTTSPPNGALYLEMTNHRLYVRDSGTWKSVVVS